MDCFGQVVSVLADRTRPEGDAPAPDRRRALVVSLAPPHPPCFADRLTWIEFLQTAADAARGKSLNGPIDMRFGEPRFNYALDFCVDCSVKHAHAMQERGRCRPSHLRQLGAKEKSGE